MSTFIMPSGKKGYNWSPEYDEKGMVKTASTDKKEVEEDEVFAIASQIVNANNEKLQAEAEGMGCEGDEDVTDEDVSDAVEDAVEDTQMDVQEAVAELAEKAEKADEVAEKVSDAVEAVEQAVAEVKEVVNEAGGVEALEEETEEFEFEVDSVEEENEGDDEDEGERDETEEGLVVEGDDDEEETEVEAYASSEGEFVKLAKISPKTRSKVRDYWVNMLGYPSDYVKLLVKDYEK